MRALVYEDNGKVSNQSVDDPSIIDPTDAIIQIDLTTICGSDLHIFGGHVPTVTEGRVLGHEGVGTVLKVGAAATSVKAGDKVLISGITSCGRCQYCKVRMFSQCEKGGWIMGNTIHGTHVVADVWNETDVAAKAVELWVVSTCSRTMPASRGRLRRSRTTRQTASTRSSPPTSPASTP